MTNEDKQSFSTNVTGATVRTLYVEREVRVFAVQESEYSSLSNLSAASTISFTVAGSALAFAVGIGANGMFVEKFTAAGEVLTKVVAPILLVVAAAAAIIGCWTLYKKSGRWNSIKNQSSSQN